MLPGTVSTSTESLLKENSAALMTFCQRWIEETRQSTKRSTLPLISTNVVWEVFDMIIT